MKGGAEGIALRKYRVHGAFDRVDLPRWKRRKLETLKRRQRQARR